MRKIVALTVVVAALVFAAPAFPLAVTNPANGNCHVALSPADFPSQGNLAAWNGVFNSNTNAPLTVFCP